MKKFMDPEMEIVEVLKSFQTGSTVYGDASDMECDESLGDPVL